MDGAGGDKKNHRKEVLLLSHFTGEENGTWRRCMACLEVIALQRANVCVPLLYHLPEFTFPDQNTKRQHVSRDCKSQRRNIPRSLIPVMPPASQVCSGDSLSAVRMCSRESAGTPHTELCPIVHYSPPVQKHLPWLDPVLPGGNGFFFK